MFSLHLTGDSLKLPMVYLPIKKILKLEKSVWSQSKSTRKMSGQVVKILSSTRCFAEDYNTILWLVFLEMNSTPSKGGGHSNFSGDTAPKHSLSYW